MKYEIDNKEIQDKEVSGWWNDDRTKKWHEFTYDKDNPLSHHLILRQKKVLDYLELLKLPKGSKVLELGGGAGQTAKKICELGFNVTGIDISKHLCDESKKKCEKYVNSGNARFINQSMEKKFPINDDEFDICVIVGSIQYVGDLNFCFNEINRVLKSNGNIILCQANMYPLLDLIKPRHMILKLVYFFLNEEFLISPSFKSILCESRLGRYFKKYENSTFMNFRFMTKGTENLDYKIRKRLYSFNRLKKLLIKFNFEIIKKTGATFFFPKKNIFFYFWFILDFLLQKILDFKIITFLINFSDNIVVLAKKK
tara:strand:+ start:357 stop:1292 length:936 start_codon:yes stop_codon:yes gene_type:complete